MLIEIKFKSMYNVHTHTRTRTYIHMYLHIHTLVCERLIDIIRSLARLSLLFVQTSLQIFTSNRESGTGENDRLF